MYYYELFMSVLTTNQTRQVVKNLKKMMSKNIITKFTNIKTKKESVCKIITEIKDIKDACNHLYILDKNIIFKYKKIIIRRDKC